MSSPIGSPRLTPRRQTIFGLLWLALGCPASSAQGQTTAIELEQLFNGGPVLVLPFRNISSDPEVEWVGEGIAEALTATLARTVELVDRGSVATGQLGLGPTEATSIDATETIAMWRRAGARWVIYGAYQQLGSQVRITARIMDTGNGAVVRSTRLDGQLDQLFALQDRILPNLAATVSRPSAMAAVAAPAQPSPRRETEPESAEATVAPTAQPTPPGARAAAVAGVPPFPIPPATVSRNAAGQATVRVVRLPGSLELDGVLDDPIYQAIEPISDLIQFEPDNGAPPTEKTEVWLFFDATHFYITARCWHSGPESEWVANEMRRDNFNVAFNESFSLMLDTFYDRRNGVLFILNPLGGRLDGQITNERDFNGDWNPIWDLKTGRFEGGWTFEAQIPFKSLRYRPGQDQVWGIQLRRNLQAKNEVAFLTPMDRGLREGALMQVSQAATLVGLEIPDSRRLFEVKPYVISNASSSVDPSRQVSNTLAGDIGLDIVKVGLTENLTADFTLNTDFAQVEADEQQVNLTRFSLFFPEKREFFLENQGVFGFGGAGGRGPSSRRSAETPILFYSRQIGLNAGREVPLLGGGRLTGRAGPFTLGLLNIQTDGEPVSGALGTNFTVARVQRNILRRSSIGAILTSRSAVANQPGSNQALGLDVGLAFYDNVSINSYWAKTHTTDLEGRDTSYNGAFAYNGDRYGLVAEHLFIDERFSPGMGFLRRPDLRKSFGSLRFSPRPQSIAWIRQLTFDGSYDYITDAAGTLETREATGNFRIDLENSDRFSASYTQTYDRLQQPFRIASDVTVPVGPYAFENARLSYSFGPQRRISGNLSAEHGSFYGGTKTTVGIGGSGFGPFGGGRIELTPQFSFEPGFSINRVELPQGRFTAQLVTTRTTYTISPTMFVSALIQYNSSNNALSSNVRLRWEYSPGSELFIVFNEQRDTLTPERFPELENRAFIVKFNRLFQF